MSMDSVTVIGWLGQACFLISLMHGPAILVDPPHPEVGYAISAHSITADAVFVSHDHFDHNFTDAAIGTPVVVEPLSAAPSDAVKGTITANSAGSEAVNYQRIFAYHDNQQGVLRGTDTLTVFDCGGLRICHLGDLGQLQLTPQQLQDIGHVDVLMIPVGGYFTIDGKQAAAIIDQLKPRVIIPMHYQTPILNADLHSYLAPITVFTDAMNGIARVVKVKSRDLKLSKATLPKQTTIFVLRYK